jgi:hypothetical protein
VRGIHGTPRRYKRRTDKGRARKSGAKCRGRQAKRFTFKVNKGWLTFYDRFPALQNK